MTAAFQGVKVLVVETNISSAALMEDMLDLPDASGRANSATRASARRGE